MRIFGIFVLLCSVSFALKGMDPPQRRRVVIRRRVVVHGVSRQEALRRCSDMIDQLRQEKKEVEQTCTIVVSLLDKTKNLAQAEKELGPNDQLGYPEGLTINLLRSFRNVEQCKIYMEQQTFKELRRITNSMQKYHEVMRQIVQPSSIT